MRTGTLGVPISTGGNDCFFLLDLLSCVFFMTIFTFLKLLTLFTLSKLISKIPDKKLQLLVKIHQPIIFYFLVGFATEKPGFLGWIFPSLT